ncbi:hypothetical protein OK074_6202 [Actinobacteria bacterium OK074]|nr:hypothetical protein OK074_6202 [Actinobacteria bacterium OK074]
MDRRRDSGGERTREGLPARVVPVRETTPALHRARSAEEAAPTNPAAMAVVQRVAGNRAATLTVQRAGESSTSAPERAEQTEQGEQTERQGAEQGTDGGQGGKGAEALTRLMASIGENTVLEKMKANFLSPRTWWPEKWLMEGELRLRRTLERRVVRGQLFNEQELEDIKVLSEANPRWLRKVGLGTYDEAVKYAEGDFKGWLKLPAGRRILSATLAFGRRDPDGPTPIGPDYTLGRFMETQNKDLPEDEKKELERERDEQIRETALDTLHPARIPADRLHPSAAEAREKHAQANDKATEILTNVLLVLQHGLKIFQPDEDGGGQHIDYEQGDVIRALAHGGRVTIRIPAVAEGESRTKLPDLLGVTEGKERAEGLDRRGFATHRTAVDKNAKDGTPGKIKEKGGIGASLTNMVTPPIPHVGAERPQMSGKDAAVGGIGAKDWNGEVILPTGSHGHMLLVFTPPTRKKDGTLMVGIETVKPGAPSPVGYKHDVRSTEATSNPESPFHGHKPDKVGSGGTGKNERYVDLREMGRAQGGGDWHAYLSEVMAQWKAALDDTEDGSDARDELYQGLVGPRRHFPGRLPPGTEDRGEGEDPQG